MTEDMNPFRPPTAEVESVRDTARRGPVAGKGRRFATFLLDYVGFIFLSMIVVGILLFLFHHGAAFLFKGGWSYLYSFGVFCAYYLFFEGLWGRTPGKLILGTVVTDMDGRPPTTSAVVKRTLARFVPFEALTFFGERGFHDKVSRTQVLRTR